MALVSVAAPTVEFDALGVTITQTPAEIDNSKLWGLRQAAALTGVVLLIVGEPPGPTPGGTGGDGLNAADVQLLIDASLSTFTEVCN